MKVLVDTSVWIDHLHTAEPALNELLESDRVCLHSPVMGELVAGSMKKREVILGSLRKLDCLSDCTLDDGLAFIEKHKLAGKGLSWTDVQLLIAVYREGFSSGSATRLSPNRHGRCDFLYADRR
jgi:predicted nucleic acid-binding protein